MSAMLRAMQSALAPLRTRVGALISRATILKTRESARVQEVQVSALDGELLSDIQRVQQFGISSHAPAGSTAVMLCVGGSRAHAMVIACDDPRTRRKGLAEGEMQIYNAFGDYVTLKASGEIVVNARSKVTVNAPVSEFSGDVTVAGKLDVTGAISSQASVSDDKGSMQKMRDTFNGHSHPGNNQTSGSQMT